MDTPVSLFDRLRVQSGEAWQELCRLYQPLIRHWLLRDPTLRDEADDLVQEVMGVVVRELPGFSRERSGAFRAWLRAITMNRLRAHWKARQRRVAVADSVLTQLEDPASQLSRQWDDEHNRHVMRRLLEMVAPQFEPATVQAFRRVVLDGEKPGHVAADLGLTVAAVYLAKSRVLKRLREEGRELLD